MSCRIGAGIRRLIHDHGCRYRWLGARGRFRVTGRSNAGCATSARVASEHERERERPTNVRNERTYVREGGRGRWPCAARGRRQQAGKYRPSLRVDSPSPSRRLSARDILLLLHLFLCCHRRRLRRRRRRRRSSSPPTLREAANPPNAHTVTREGAKVGKREDRATTSSASRGFHATFPRSTARWLKDPWKKDFYG